MPDFLSNASMRIALAILVVLMGAVFFWQPLQMVLSGARVTNDFVLQTAGGTVDTKTLRGKVLAVVFGYGKCGDVCAKRLASTIKAYDSLAAAERSQVKMIMVTVDPERDTPEGIAKYAAGIHAGLVGVTGKPEEIKAVADAFGADYRKFSTPDGDYVMEVSALTYLIGADGKFVSVLNEALPVEKVAAALRARLPSVLPPS